MIIGGRDLVFPTAMTVSSQKRLLLSYFQKLHPEGVWEDVGTEFMFYLTQEDLADWTLNGRTDSNAVKMVHVLCEKGCLTIVHEGEINSDEIKKMLRANWMF